MREWRETHESDSVEEGESVEEEEEAVIVVSEAEVVVVAEMLSDREERG